MGAQQNAAARCGGCAGVGRARRKDGGVPRRARRGRRFAGAARARRCVWRRDGCFRGAESRSLPPGLRQEAGRGRAWPREAHKGRVAGATARCGHMAGRRGTGGIRRLSGVDAGKARAGAAVYGGRDGYNRWRRASYRDAAGGGAGKTAAPSAACVWFQATSAIEAVGGRKNPISPYKEALFFRARLLSNQSCFAPESLSLRSGCFFGGAE